MRWGISRHDSARSIPVDHVEAWRADAFVEGYVCWREASEAVRAAYDRWRAGSPRDLGLAFAAYTAALDQEEHVARMFRERAELVSGPWT
jgi:hypothetical protein